LRWIGNSLRLGRGAARELSTVFIKPAFDYLVGSEKKTSAIPPTRHLTSQLVDMAPQNKVNVTVLGYVASQNPFPPRQRLFACRVTQLPRTLTDSCSAGVIGLTTAMLLSRDKRFNITIVAKHMPGDYDIEYASPWAGANYLPYVSNRPSEKLAVFAFWPCCLPTLPTQCPLTAQQLRLECCY
jgi:hypothetical protein